MPSATSSPMPAVKAPGLPTGSVDVLLRIEAVPLTRGRLSLASSVSFELVSGRFIELQGPNGAGKSTLLRLLAGVQPVESGSLQVVGRQAFFAAPFGLRRELTVLAQLQVSVSLYGIDLSLAQCKAALGEVGLAHKALDLTSRLSQGQRARLGLCILKASRAPVWLMDEPVNALDSQGIALLGTLLREHLQSGGCAVVATHQTLPALLPDLAPVCDGVVSFEGGQAHWRPNPDSTASSPPALPPALPPVSGAAPTSQRPWVESSSPSWLEQSRRVFAREWRLFNAAPKAAVWPAVFHALVLCLFPIGLGSDVNLLLKVAAGLFWVSCLLASVLSASPMFESDYNEGVLNQMSAAGLSMSWLAFGKMLVAWVTQGGALALISGALALQYRLPAPEIGFLMLSLAIGAGVMVHLSALFGSMTLMARQSSMLVYLLALPLFVPVLVFGTSVLNSVQMGQDPMWPLLVLAGLSLLCCLTVPFLVGQLLIWAME